ncbi:MAG TPA: hypothetical protein VND96_15755 [Candidatus Micrarchaeaceae archaeon]|nr:hypothetical protein [Candidatus Micrarchaeaceae archaeon]
MKALRWHGTSWMTVDKVPDPQPDVPTWFQALGKTSVPLAMPGRG